MIMLLPGQRTPKNGEPVRVLPQEGGFGVETEAEFTLVFVSDKMQTPHLTPKSVFLYCSGA